jgi:sortase (surface protein transpeptidase)
VRMFRLSYINVLCLLLIGMLVSACGGQTLTQTVSPPRVPTPTMAPAPPEATTTPALGVPVRLIIPRIKVDAPIEEVGIAQNGDLATPTKNPWDGVGWYKNGAYPGAEGSAVMNGHLDRPGGYPAVFWNLRYLRAGDRLTVQTASGQSLQFRVLRLASYPPQSAPVQNIFGMTGGRYLNLITCTGTWVPAQHQTTLRLVVYTELV